MFSALMPLDEFRTRSKYFVLVRLIAKQRSVAVVNQELANSNTKQELWSKLSLLDTLNQDCTAPTGASPVAFDEVGVAVL